MHEKGNVIKDQSQSVSPFRMMAYLLAANTEAVALVIGAWWIGEWLNEHYSVEFNWYTVTFPTAAIVIAHSWFLIFRVLTKKSDD